MPSLPASSANRMPERGEVWLAHLNPRRGTEVGKTRPVLVVQAQALIDAGHPSTIIVPLTTNLIDEAEPLRIRGIGNTIASTRFRLAHRSNSRDR
jgi:mRNA-degrading endonuclease toxin of MazEF toxin-antitoxin module